MEVAIRFFQFNVTQAYAYMVYSPGPRVAVDAGRSGYVVYFGGEEKDKAESDCAPYLQYTAAISGSHIPKSDAKEAAAADDAKSTQAIVERHKAIVAKMKRNSCADWNEAYQRLVDELAKAEPGSAAVSDVTFKIHELTNDFCSVARTLGRIIVCEASLPASQKSIAPVTAGGVAGGEKFICCGVFFKRVHDEHNIYGCEDSALKSARHELKGARAASKSVTELRTPLMTVVDFRGFRLIATSILPVSGDTLVYGSNDAGQTVHKDKAVHKLMTRVGKQLGLKAHTVGANKPVELVGPCDIEVHRGKDSRLYLLDTARVFPPQKPDTTLRYVALLAKETSSVFLSHVGELPAMTPDQFPDVVALPLGAKRDDVSIALLSELGSGTSLLVCLKQDKLDTKVPINKRLSVLTGQTMRGDAVVVFRNIGQHLWALLRPEFLASWSAREGGGPLSSDAFTGFGVDKAAAHNGEVERATKTLLTETVPKVAAVMESQPFSIDDSRTILEIMHSHGVNMRLLSHVFAHVHQHRIRARLLTEMVSRLLKNTVRQQLRKVHAVDTKACHTVIVSWLNLVFGTSSQSNDFWSVVVPLGLAEKFGLNTLQLCNQEMQHLTSSKEYSIRMLVDEAVLLQSLQESLGVVVRVSCLERFRSKVAEFITVQPFSPSDLVRLSAVDTRLWCGSADLVQTLQQPAAAGTKSDLAEAELAYANALELFGESHVEIPGFALRLASALLDSVSSFGDPATDSTKELERAWSLADSAWSTLNSRLRDCDMRVAVLYLRGRIRMAQMKNKEAIEELLSALSSAILVYGTVDRWAVQDGHLTTAVPLGHPIYLVLLNYLIRITLRDCKELKEATWHNQETLRLLSAGHLFPPENPQTLLRLFGQQMPDVVKAAWDIHKMHTPTWWLREKRERQIHAYAASREKALRDRVKVDRDVLQAEATKVLDESYTFEVERFLDMRHMWNHGRYFLHNDPTSLREDSLHYGAEPTTIDGLDHTPAEAKTANAGPTASLAEMAHFLFPSKELRNQGAWAMWPVGAFARYYKVQQTHLTTGVQSFDGEMIRILVERTADQGDVVLEGRKIPADNDWMFFRMSSKPDYSKIIKQDERKCFEIDGKSYPAAKTTWPYVDTKNGVTSDTEMWSTCEPGFEGRESHPFLTIASTVVKSPYFTSKSTNTTTLTHLRQEYKLGDTTIPVYRTQQDFVQSGIEASTVNLCNTQVPGHKASMTYTTTSRGTKSVSIEEMRSHGVFSATELAEWLQLEDKRKTQTKG